MSEKIYVILGSTGEYSDRSEWCVLAVRSEDAAKSLVTEYDRLSKAIEAEVREYHRLNSPPDFRKDRAAWEAWDYVKHGEAKRAIRAKHPDPRYDDESTYWYSEIDLV